MSTAAIKRPARPAKPGTYRGVTLQSTAGQSRFSASQIKKAVERAVAKNADALAGGK